MGPPRSRCGRLTATQERRCRGGVSGIGERVHQVGDGARTPQRAGFGAMQRKVRSSRPPMWQRNIRRWISAGFLFSHPAVKAMRKFVLPSMRRFCPALSGTNRRSMGRETSINMRRNASPRNGRPCLPRLRRRRRTRRRKFGAGFTTARPRSRDAASRQRSEARCRQESHLRFKQRCDRRPIRSGAERENIWRRDSGRISAKFACIQANPRRNPRAPLTRSLTRSAITLSSDRGNMHPAHETAFGCWRTSWRMFCNSGTEELRLTRPRASMRPTQI